MRNNSPPPNLLLIDCHDLGAALGSYGWLGMNTPNLDRLAAEGCRFTDYFASAPICIPSRAGMYTGQHPASVGCYGQEVYHQDSIAIARRFKEHGYATCLSGWNILNSPEWAGYDMRLPDKPEKISEPTDLFLSLPQPFFAHFSFGLVHRPYGNLPDPHALVNSAMPPYLPDLPLVRRDLACFAAQVARLDQQVGNLLDGLQQSGLSDRTITVFTTDHGPALARAKHTLYDSGLRTALLIRYPDRILPGSTCSALLSNIDLMPTLLELAGLPIPGSIAGRSFLPLLDGKEEAGRDAVFAAHTWGRRAGLWYYTPSRCVRTQAYKLIRNYTGTPCYVDTDWLARFGAERRIPEQLYGHSTPEWELYDLQADPWELTNRAGERQLEPVQAELARLLDRHLHETGDRIRLGFVPNQENKPDVPLWVRAEGGAWQLRPFYPAESGEMPFEESTL
jgi:arylsulfatase A-like enzyme